MSEKELEELAAELRDALPPLDPDERRLALALYRLLAEGAPVGEDRVAAAAGVPAEQVARALAGWPGLFRDDAGDVIGFWGLTVRELPPHALAVDGRRLWTWCAWDSLFIPGLLGTTARVESDAVTAVVGPDGVEEVSPPDAVLSFVRPAGKFDHDVILNFCHHVLFFPSEQAGSEWIAERPGAFLLPLEQGFELGRRTFGELLAGSATISA